MIERSTTGNSAFATRFRALLATLVPSSLSDGELLRQYADHRCGEAFAELVRRLGPGVWSVCSRVLDHHADAEDAFQATFLVLARKAKSVNPPGKVAAWLHGVASLAARKARAMRSRRTARVRNMPDVPERGAMEAAADPELGRTLHEELHRLPERYRLPIVLCELRELTTAQAAGELGWPVGTVASRLSRGRALLTGRLLRRGIAPAAAMAALTPAATAAVPATLIANTIAAAQGVSCAASVTTLTLEVLRAMAMTKLSLIGAGLAATAAFTIYGAASLQPALVAAPAPEKSAAAVETIERFKLDGLAVLLKPEEIRKDLALTAEQGKALDVAQSDMNDKIEAAMKKMFQPAIPAPVPGPGGPPGGIPAGAPGVIMATEVAGPNSAIEEQIAAFDKAAIAILKPEQTRRLRQVAVQVMGPKALLDRRVIRALELSAEQEDQIDAAMAGLSKAALDPVKHAADSDAVMAAAMKVLGADQKAKWEKLVGPPLASEVLAKANPLFHHAMDGLAPMGGMIRLGGVAPIPAQPLIPAQPAIPPKP